ncbi:MAG: DUF4177 domain-containing protein [Anaerolineae bacterium]|nr:MAG: DUF4177 domain-containing protein [Anaerolineae bacterium]
MAKWEYKVLKEGIGIKGLRAEDIEEELNLWGAEGWELVGVARYQAEFVAVLKRPVGGPRRQDQKDRWF